MTITVSNLLAFKYWIRQMKPKLSIRFKQEKCFCSQTKFQATSGGLANRLSNKPGQTTHNHQQVHSKRHFKFPTALPSTGNKANKARAAMNWKVPSITVSHSPSLQRKILSLSISHVRNKGSQKKKENGHEIFSDMYLATKYLKEVCHLCTCAYHYAPSQVTPCFLILLTYWT